MGCVLFYIGIRLVKDLLGKTKQKSAGTKALEEKFKAKVEEIKKELKTQRELASFDLSIEAGEGAGLYKRATDFGAKFGEVGSAGGTQNVLGTGQHPVSLQHFGLGKFLLGTEGFPAKLLE